MMETMNVPSTSPKNGSPLDVITAELDTLCALRSIAYALLSDRDNALLQGIDIVDVDRMAYVCDMNIRTITRYATTDYGTLSVHAVAHAHDWPTKLTNALFDYYNATTPHDWSTNS